MGSLRLFSPYVLIILFILLFYLLSDYHQGKNYQFLVPRQPKRKTMWLIN